MYACINVLTKLMYFQHISFLLLRSISIMVMVIMVTCMRDP